MPTRGRPIRTDITAANKRPIYMRVDDCRQSVATDAVVMLGAVAAAVLTQSCRHGHVQITLDEAAADV